MTMSSDSVERLVSVVSRLRDEGEGLRHALRTTTGVERATGVLMERHGISARDARERLEAVSRACGRSLEEIAEDVVSARSGETFRVVPRPSTTISLEDDPERLSLHSRFLRCAVAVQESESPQQVLDAALGIALRHVGAELGAVHVVDPDGWLRLAASSPPGWLHEWLRISPELRVPMNLAGIGGTASWLATPAAIADQFPLMVPGSPSALASLPISHEGILLGCLTVGWPTAPEWTPGRKRFVSGIASLMSAELRRLLVASPDLSGLLDPRTESTFLDAAIHPTMVMQPIREPDGMIVDFEVTWAGRSTQDLTGRVGRELVGGRLLERYPGAAMSGLFEALVEVVDCQRTTRLDDLVHVELVDGVEVARRFTVHCAPLLGGALVGWIDHQAEDSLSEGRHLAEEVAELGTWEYDAITGHMSWSPNLESMLGRERGVEPSLAGLARCAAGDDRNRVDDVLSRALGGEEGRVSFAATVPSGALRVLLVHAVPVTGPGGSVVRVHGIVRDITEQATGEERLRRTHEELEQQRRQGERDRIAIEAMQRAALPDGDLQTVPGVQVAARYLPVEEDPLGGDWYDVFAHHGRLWLAVGDVAGHGVHAAAAMSQLRNAARALILIDSSPAGICRTLNQLAMSLSPEVTGTCIIGFIDPAEQKWTWSCAGHPAPMLVHRDSSHELLASPGGMMLGVIRDTAYETRVDRLEAGDSLVLMTDGLFERPGEVLDESLRRLFDGLVAPGTPEALCERLVGARPLVRRDDACLLVAQSA